MSNLGMYQRIVEWSKIVGGPIQLLGITAVGGFVILRLGEAGVKKTYKIARKKMLKITSDNSIIFKVVSEGEDECGVEFAVGDEYKVLESDGESILIEKIGDSNNPYCVSGNFLRSISNFV